MTACLLALVAASAAPPAQAGGDPPQGVAGQNFQACGTVAGRLAGRVLGRLVRRGMTPGQVRQLLGESSCPIDSGGLVGGCCFAFRRYDHLGLTVTFLSEPGGEMRVSGVAFSPLCD